MNDSDIDLKCQLVETLVRNRITGGKKISVDQLLNHSVRDSDAGRARQLLNDEMVPRSEASIERYGGGHRENIRLGSIDKAVEFLEENGGDVPFGF